MIIRIKIKFNKYSEKELKEFKKAIENIPENSIFYELKKIILNKINKKIKKL